jgi:hypothetical protein
MDKDTVIANTITMGAVGMTVMSPVQTLTLVALSIGIIANLVSIYRNLKDKE